MKHPDNNVLNGPLDVCSRQPLTGFLRDGECQIPPGDHGRHGVYAQVTQDFLEFTLSRGNDLSTPTPLAGFPGLKPGDRCCLCADRWKEARDHGAAPPVVLASTHVDVLERIALADLIDHALDADPK